MKKILLTIGIICGLSLCSASSLVGASSVFSPSSSACNQSGSNLCQDINGSDNNSIFSIIKTITNLLMYVLGAISVLMLIIAGISYATSAGKPDQVSSASKTAAYAAIGLVVAISGYAVINFVVSAFV